MVTIVDDKNLGYTLGAAEYMTKPIDRERLGAILSRYRCPVPPCPMLLIEDDDVTRGMMRTMLEREGWQVTEAANGREGLERVTESQPNVILLDLMMPEMDGFEFLEQLHARPESASVPVVVITAKELTRGRSRAADRVGAEDPAEGRVLSRGGSVEEGAGAGVGLYQLNGATEPR